MNEQIKRKLFDLELDPPQRTWGKIMQSLDDEAPHEIVAHLQNLEITPPQHIWNSITDQLDEESVDTLPIKLYNLEVEPPVSAWSDIASALDEEKSLPRIQPLKRKIPVLKYAVAASLLAMIGFGVKWLTAERTEGPVSQRIVPSEQKQNSQAKDERENSVQSTPQEQSRLTNNLPKEHPPIAASSASIRNTAQKSIRRVAKLFELPKQGMTSAGDFQETNLNVNIPGSQPGFADAADRYMIFENPEGNQIRISKKLATALGCAYGDKNSDEYRHCLDQLKKWREKIARSQMTPSPDNFMDIFEMIRSADENQF